jgi:hypothetical protein
MTLEAWSTWYSMKVSQGLGTKSLNGFGDRFGQTTSGVIACVETWPKPYSNSLSPCLDAAPKPSRASGCTTMRGLAQSSVGVAKACFEPRVWVLGFGFALRRAALCHVRGVAPSFAYGWQPFLTSLFEILCSMSMASL